MYSSGCSFRKRFSSSWLRYADELVEPRRRWTLPWLGDAGAEGAGGGAVRWEAMWLLLELRLADLPGGGAVPVPGRTLSFGAEGGPGVVFLRKPLSK